MSSLRTRPSELAPPMLTLHRTTDRRLGTVIAVAGRTTVADQDLRSLGYTSRKVSGKKADGGPGHRVPQVFVVPLARWETDELLRLKTKLLLATHNPGTRTQALLELAEQIKQARTS